MIATKEQEREALKKIRKVVADLGEDSYIAAAFEGCFEIAEDNIENDFACSPMDSLRASEKECKILKESIQDHIKAYRELEDKYKALQSKYNSEKSIYEWNIKQAEENNKLLNKKTLSLDSANTLTRILNDYYKVIVKHNYLGASDLGIPGESELINIERMIKEIQVINE